MAMNQEIEVSGPSVEEAIATGLSKLRVKRDQVDVKVLDEGRRAILGIGGRDAVVRITVLPEPETNGQPEKMSKSVKEDAPPLPVRMETVSNEPVDSVSEIVEPVEVVEEVIAISEGQTKEVGTSAEMPAPDEAEAAVSVVTELLDLMQVDATISNHLTEQDDLTGRRLNVVDINGDDLGVLIGPRGETLDALQYISRLMVGHRTRQRANFVIDIEGYRERREQALSRLAERMANKAVKRGSPVTLEAMPAYDRRIIHMALRESEDVRTESTGEGNRRRVRIFPV